MLWYLLNLIGAWVGYNIEACKLCLIVEVKSLSLIIYISESTILQSGQFVFKIGSDEFKFSKINFFQQSIRNLNSLLT